MSRDYKLDSRVGPTTGRQGVSLVTLPAWKSYVRLSFYVRTGSVDPTGTQSKDFRHTLTHHEAHMCLGKGGGASNQGAGS